MRNKQQRRLWEYVGEVESVKIDRHNEVGPFKIGGEDEIPRHMNCINYEACLAYAAHHRWPSFSCAGCRKTKHGRFEELKFSP